MVKKFNFTGTCIPGRHFMVNTSGKIDQIIKLIEEEEYFTINRPRQYGKTTTLFLLEKRLEQLGLLPVSISFEGIGDAVFQDEALFCQKFIKIAAQSFLYTDEELYSFFIKDMDQVNDLEELSLAISRWVRKTPKEIVLLIDEVDKSSNNQLFLSFLGMLRNKYLRRDTGKDFTFKSVILAGVHDVKSLKLKIAPGSERKYNSPWNIAADFTVDLSFAPDEIATMLADYAEDQGVKMDIPAISERLYYYTSGYPFLVSRLCSIINKQVMKEGTWLPEDVHEAVTIILDESNTNFESLIKNLTNNKDLYATVEMIILEGEEVEFNQLNPVINMGLVFGIFIKKGRLVDIHNRIYSQLVYNYMSVNLKISELQHKNMGRYNFRNHFLKPDDDSLDFEKVLTRFQAFMKEQYSTKDEVFLERNGRLIFLSFIKPIINGKGFDFKEVQVSTEKRLDVVITYGPHKYIVELKIWNGPAAYREGLGQLADYLERQNCHRGYLVIFDFRRKKTWSHERIQEQGKDLFAVWV